MKKSASEKIRSDIASLQRDVTVYLIEGNDTMLEKIDVILTRKHSELEKALMDESLEAANATEG